MTESIDALIEKAQSGLGAFICGDPSQMKSLFSTRDDVTLANPFGPPRLGRAEVEKALEQAASNFKGGSVRFEEVSRYATPELAYLVQLERYEGQLANAEDTSRISLRVTMIFRREDNVWKIAHRHADPITTAQSVGSIVQGSP